MSTGTPRGARACVGPAGAQRPAVSGPHRTPATGRQEGWPPRPLGSPRTPVPSARPAPEAPRLAPRPRPLGSPRTQPPAARAQRPPLFSSSFASSLSVSLFLVLWWLLCREAARPIPALQARPSAEAGSGAPTKPPDSPQGMLRALRPAQGPPQSPPTPHGECSSTLAGPGRLHLQGCRCRAAAPAGR